MNGYKIRNAERLYSTGGHDPIFTKQGKFWKSRRAVMLHLALFKSFRRVYAGCWIEEYEMKFIYDAPMETWNAPIEAEARRKKERDRANASYKQFEIKRKLAEIERLQSELINEGVL